MLCVNCSDRVRGDGHGFLFAIKMGCASVIIRGDIDVLILLETGYECTFGYILIALVADSVDVGAFLLDDHWLLHDLFGSY